MSRITIANPDLSTTQRTKLTASIAKTGTALAVQNSTGFVADDYVVVGNMGNETTELRKVASAANINLITVDALVMDHPVNTLVSKIDYNQIKVYSSATQSGTYSLLATIDITVDNPAGTRYDDAAGTSSTWYKVKYFNSTTSALSDFSSAVLATGFTQKSRKAMIDDVSMLVNDKENQYISREEIGEKLNLQQQTWWLSPYTKRDSVKTSNIVTASSVNYIELPTDLDKLKDDYSVRYNYKEGTTTDEWYCLRIIPKAEWYERFGDNLSSDSDELEYCAIDDTTSPKRLLLGPTPVTASLPITVEYYCKPTDLVNDSDETICPIGRVLTLPVAAEILLVRGEMDKSDRLSKMANALVLGEVSHVGTKGGSFKMKYRKQRGSGRFKGGSVEND